MSRRLTVAAVVGVLLLGALSAVVGSATAEGSRYTPLEHFTPVSATTWWAVTGANLPPHSLVLRTSDSGDRWRNVSPTKGLVGSTYFLNPKAGWVVGSELHPPLFEPLYRTLDGGKSWQRIGAVPSPCTLDFVNESDGWCIEIAAAGGSAGVTLYRTTDGGGDWSLVSRTDLTAPSEPPGSLPAGCDKLITFTTPEVGWASLGCNGGDPAPLYWTTDAGAQWSRLSPIPLPSDSSPSFGSYLGTPAVRGRDLAIAVTFGTARRPSQLGIATSANGGSTWTLHRVPGRPMHWSVDLIDPSHWRITDGKTITLSDNAGRSWQSLSPHIGLSDSGGFPLRLDFITSEQGWVVPSGNGGQLWWTHNGGRSWTAPGVP